MRYASQLPLLPISMPTLKTQNGEPLKDAAGNEIKAGQTVTDSMFGDGIAEGTVALEKGPGCNVTIDWLGPNTSGKPKSRGTEFLTVKFASGGGGTTTRIHTGAEYESGAVFEQRGRNDADAGERCVGEGWGRGGVGWLFGSKDQVPNQVRGR